MSHLHPASQQVKSNGTVRAFCQAMLKCHHDAHVSSQWHRCVVPRAWLAEAARADVTDQHLLLVMNRATGVWTWVQKQIQLYLKGITPHLDLASPSLCGPWIVPFWPPWCPSGSPDGRGVGKSVSQATLTKENANFFTVCLHFLQMFHGFNSMALQGSSCVPRWCSATSTH